MLSPIEKLLFVLALAASLILTYRGADRIRRVIQRGGGTVGLDRLGHRFLDAIIKFLTPRTVLGARLGPSVAHALVAWGFIYYLLVNVGDMLEAFFRGFVFMGMGRVGGRLPSRRRRAERDGAERMITLVLRRLLFGQSIFAFRPETPLLPSVKHGIRLDSTIVAVFILVHISARVLGASVHMAESGSDPWQPFAAVVSRIWQGVPRVELGTVRHLAFWLALGSSLAFLPYFPRSKHVHLFFAPLNFLTKPRRRSIGALDPIDFDDERLTHYGAAKLEDLSRPQLIHACACIMCNRCQDVCPPNVTGKALSPSALEINKRYFANEHAQALAEGRGSRPDLIAFATSEEAIWACTACGACIEICPVGDEPMRDILDIRRSRVLVDSAFPEPLQNAYRALERTGNPWGLGGEHRLDWCAGLDIATIEQNPHPEVLWWVGCAPATDARAQRTVRDFARILRSANVTFAVLGARERCTGDPARLSGNEYLFSLLARQNVETLNSIGPARIVVTCPHCLHTLKTEYPDFGGRYDVVHHTQLIGELIRAERLVLEPRAMRGVAFHDPCYLGRHNGVYDEPRDILREAGVELAELPRRRNRSFCCGAGGAQIWKEEERGLQRVSSERFREVRETGATTLAVGCPFCMMMLSDASSAAGGAIAVREVAELVASALTTHVPAFADRARTPDTSRANDG